MLDSPRAPMLVGVADNPAALVRCAELAPAERFVDLVEARLDLFPAPSLDACADACARLEATGTPVLVTLRSQAQGGRSGLSDAERASRFRAALAIASWADVEDDATIVGEVAALVAARPRGRLVVSHHDFQRTPALDDLRRIVAGALAVPTAIAKIATAVKTEDDRQALLALLAEHAGRVAVIGMGSSEGLRIELAARGSLLAYGYLDQPTAPGQLSAAETHARLLAASPDYAARKTRRVQPE